jgi:hypothetical protein
VAGDFGQCALQHILHRDAVRLRLPAMEAGAVIFDTQRNSQYQVPPAAGNITGEEQRLYLPG